MGPKAKNIIYFNYKQCLKTIFPSFSRKFLTTVPSDEPNAALNTLNCHKKKTLHIEYFFLPLLVENQISC